LSGAARSDAAAANERATRRGASREPRLPFARLDRCQARARGNALRPVARSAAVRRRRVAHPSAPGKGRSLRSLGQARPCRGCALTGATPDAVHRLPPDRHPSRPAHPTKPPSPVPACGDSKPLGARLESADRLEASQRSRRARAGGKTAKSAPPFFLRASSARMRPCISPKTIRSSRN